MTTATNSAFAFSAMPSGASLRDIAEALERDGADAFERLDAFQRRAVADALADFDDGESLEAFAEAAVDTLEAFADTLDGDLETLADEYASAIMESDRLADYWDTMRHDLNESATRERLESLLDDELTADEFETLADAIAAGMHDGKAPGESGPFKAWNTFWDNPDALLSIADDGEEFVPVSDKLEQRLGKFFDRFNALNDAGILDAADESRDAFAFLPSVTLADGNAEGAGDCFALAIPRPQQILFFVDVEGVAEALEEYRAEEKARRHEFVIQYIRDDGNAIRHWRDDWKAFLFAYRRALAWSESDGAHESLEEFDFGAEALAETRAHVWNFIAQTGESLERAASADEYSWASAGHDFALTRNGHGAGFWDRDELDSVADARDHLDAVAVEFGPVHAWIDNDTNGVPVIHLER